jgi:hypothetical protein
VERRDSSRTTWQLVLLLVEGAQRPRLAEIAQPRDARRAIYFGAR